MGWLDVNSWGDSIENALGVGQYDPTNPDRAQLQGVGQQAQGFGNQALGNYGQSSGQLQGTYNQMGQTQNYLQGVMNGQGPAAGQLQQGLAQNMAAQRSLAASQPGSVEAARTAGMNNSRLQTGIAGQTALAGMQERNAAAQQLNQAQLNQAQLQYGARGQDAAGANAAYGTAGNSYTSTIQNPQKTGASLIGGGAGGLVGGVAAMFSDKRLKKNIEDADEDAGDMLDRLSSALSKRLATIGASK